MTDEGVFVQVDLGAALEERAPVRWALDELSEQLRNRSIRLDGDASSGHYTRVLVTSGERSEPLRAATGEILRLPAKEESFAIVRNDDVLTVWGRDVRGIVYGLTEVADRVRHQGLQGLHPSEPIVEEPALRVRSISRVFACEATDKAWFYDRAGWREYLSMLASNRYNRFSLAFGMAYNYPYHNNMIRDVYLHFPYPFLVDIPEHEVRAVGLQPEERDANLEMLRFIASETARHGLEFQLGLWTQRYDFEDATKASYRIKGITESNLAPYCRAALVKILEACPEITGLTFRVHVEGGIEEGEYGFWKNLLEGVASVGRPIEIDLHAKGLDHEMLNVARASGMPLAVSPKYIAEHMGLAYHPAAIREREYPPAVIGNIREQLSHGSRKFLRYSYGDLLTKERDWKVIFRIWPGTQRVLLWGDPELASGYGRSSSYCDSDGVELCEPQTFRGRMGTGIPGARHNYKQEWLVPRRDWEKYEYHYRVWGRRLFSPAIGLDDCLRYLKTECGDAAEECMGGLAYAGRILPLVTQTHGPSVSNNLYWPEMYTNLTILGEGVKRPYGADMDQPTRFGNVSTFDPQLFASPKEFVETILGQDCRKYTPLDVADWLDELATKTEGHASLLRTKGGFGRPAVQRIHVDLQILSGIARFFAEKYRAACWAEAFILTGINEAREEAVEHLRQGCLAWQMLAQVSTAVYQDDISFGIQHYMRGTWKSRLTEIQNEILDVESWREEDGPAPLVQGDEGRPYLQALRNRTRTINRAFPVRFPETFTPGEEIEIEVDAPSGATDLMLHYRHVNQAERWVSAPMTLEGGWRSAKIPADYSRSKFHIQFYTTAREGNAVVMSPGLAQSLSNEPYYTIMQR